MSIFMLISVSHIGEEPMYGDQHQYKYMTVDDMKSLGDDSMRMDVTRDEKGEYRNSYGTYPLLMEYSCMCVAIDFRAVHRCNLEDFMGGQTEYLSEKISDIILKSETLKFRVLSKCTVW